MQHTIALVRPLAVAAALVAALVTALAASGCGSLMMGPQGHEAGMRRAEVKRDVTEVWYRAKEAMGIMSSTPIAVDEGVPRRIEGTVDGAKVEVRVMAWDLGRTRIEVRAREFGLPDEVVAERVLATLVDRATSTPGG